MQPHDPGTAAPASFDEMFRDTYWPMVRSLAIACGDREVAEDAVQDAFERAFVRWRRISRYDDPPSWIRHVALNRLRDHFRKETNKRRAVDRLSSDAVAAVPAYERPADVAAMLAQLPQQQRIAAALFYVEDLTVREVAESMKLSEGAVKYHLHAARASLAGRVHAT